MTLTQMVREWRKDFWREHETDREHAERVEYADKEAGWYFDKATVEQLADFRAATASAANLFGHGSDAHCASVDMAHRTWTANTSEARELREFTAEEIMRDGEVSEATSFKWDQLIEREALIVAMNEAAE